MKYVILVFLITAVIALGGCPEQNPAPATETALTPEEIVTYFTELTSNGIQETTLQVADLDEKIAKVEEKEAKLAEIKVKIDEDIAYLDELMADTTVRNNQYYEYIMPDEYLGHYQNDCYKLVEFKRQYHYSTDFEDGVPWIIFQDIIIMDNTSGVKNNIEVFEKSLAVEKSPYVRGKTTRLEAAEKSSKILNDMLQYSDNWEINEESNEIYSVSGYGLGYTDQLTDGKWLYYMVPKTMEPQYPDSTRLKDILTAKTG